MTFELMMLCVQVFAWAVYLFAILFAIALVCDFFRVLYWLTRASLRACLKRLAFIELSDLLAWKLLGVFVILSDSEKRKELRSKQYRVDPDSWSHE